MFVLTREQEEIQRAARSFVRERLPTSHLRALRDRREPAGLSRDVWRAMADLGWAAILVPEDQGGAGMGLVEIGLILEECGRTLAPTPMLATAVLGIGALLAAPERGREALDAAMAGDRLLALAFEERPRFAPYAVATSARRTASGWRLDGAKGNVLDGSAADQLIVVARVSGDPDGRDGLGLFLVDARAPGVRVEPLSRVDSRSAASLRLDGVVIGEDRVLGVPGQGADLLDRLLDRATAALCAEMLGGIQEAFDQTIAYLKVRKQFGVPIGSFQALKHRAAQMFCEVELTRSVVRAALAALDEGRPDAASLVSAAKARASDTYILVANEAIQMHGGIGVTDELDIGFYLKRARVAEMTFGTAAYHRDRFARLNGY
jgi:alkylation response protein AidB-like acyl-CoA dehydrogenase